MKNFVLYLVLAVSGTAYGYDELDELYLDAAAYYREDPGPIQLEHVDQSVTPQSIRAEHKMFLPKNSMPLKTILDLAVAFLCIILGTILFFSLVMPNKKY